MALPVQINTDYKYIETINLQELGIRKKIGIYIANDLNDITTMIFHITQKSRFL